MTTQDTVKGLQEMRSSFAQTVTHLSKTLAPGSYAIWTTRLASLDSAIKVLGTVRG